MEKPGVPRKIGPTGIAQRRAAGWKHGKRAQVVTVTEALWFKLARIDPELPDLLDRYIAAVGGDLSALDQDLAAGMATKAAIRQRMIEEIATRGVVLEDAMFDSAGKEVGVRVRPNPMLDPLKHFDEQLGYTAEQARLTRRSRGQGARDEAIAAALQRDTRLRGYRAACLARGDPTMGLPPPDPELLAEKAAAEKPG